MSENKTLVIYGSATIGDIEPLSDEGSQTFLLHGKKVKLLNKSGKKVKRIDIDGRRMYQKQEGLPTADISRVWVNGGQVVTGQATIGDLTDIVTYADTKREWVNGGLVVTGSATIGDTDSTVIYGDTVRDNLAYGVRTGSIDYTTHVITYGVNPPTNKIFVVSCAPSTTYDITMNMYSRFRVASYAGIPADGTVLSTYAINSLDTNSTTTQSGSSQTVSITTGASDTYLFIQYWTSTDGDVADTIKSSINVQIHTSSGYVTDGLVFQLDCANMDYTNGTWTDKVGGIVFSTTGTKPTAGTDGGVVFNNSKLSSTTMPDYPYSTCTIEYVIKPNSLSGNYAIFFPKAQADAIAAMWAGTIYPVGSGLRFTVPTSSITNNLFTFSSTNNTGYINRASLTTASTDTWSKYSSTTAYVGGRNSTEPYYGSIYQIRIYNRQLTQAEMLANQAVDMATYGITVS